MERISAISAQNAARPKKVEPRRQAPSDDDALPRREKDFIVYFGHLNDRLVNRI